MKRTTYTILLLGLVVATACSEVNQMQDPHKIDQLPITFSPAKTSLSLSTKVSEEVESGETDFGDYSITANERELPATKIDANGFTDKDTIGIYMYYNYWFADKAESVILDDASLYIGAVENILDPYKIWTFSTVGGNVPYIVRTIGYYPKSAGAVLEEVTPNFKWTHDDKKDFLVADQTYSYASDGGGYDDVDTGSRFKKYILETLDGTIALNFKHQLATFSFYIYKAAHVDKELTIKSLKVNYTCSKDYYFVNNVSDINNPLSYWSQSPEDLVTKESTLKVVSNGTLGKSAPTDPLVLERGIFLPPYSVINSISFIFNVATYNYKWHPHIANMAVKNYNILFELDPDRLN